jgi:hypothetical protein
MTLPSPFFPTAPQQATVQYLIMFLLQVESAFGAVEPNFLSPHQYTLFSETGNQHNYLTAKTLNIYKEKITQCLSLALEIL